MMLSLILLYELIQLTEMKLFAVLFLNVAQLARAKLAARTFNDVGLSTSSLQFSRVGPARALAQLAIPRLRLSLWDVFGRPRGPEPTINLKACQMTSGHETFNNLSKVNMSRLIGLD